MHPVPVRLRRARRTDFVAVMKTLASNGLPVPPPDRSTLRRFRRLVADLGSDFYVAVVEEQVAGFVHVTYTRQIASGACARIEAMAVQRERQGRGVGSLLLDLACRRAKRRRSADLRCEVGLADGSLAEFLAKKGWVREREVLRCGAPAGETAAGDSRIVNVEC